MPEKIRNPHKNTATNEALLRLKKTSLVSSIYKKEMDVENIRKLFPITTEKVYLNHASTGPMTTRARNAINKLLDIYQFESDITKEFLESAEEETRNLAAQLVGAHPDEIGLVKNTSQGLIIPMNALGWEAGSNVILRKGGFPANVCPWIYNLPHVEKRYIEVNNNETILESCKNALCERTKAITVDWVDFLSGSRVDLKRLGDFCQEKNVFLFVDGIQGLGALQLDLSELNVDVFSAGATKWMFGPQGIAIMYISKKLLSQLNLTNAGWLSAQWENFHHFSEIPPIKQSTARYEEGTKNLLGIFGFREHLKLLLEVGPDKIQERIFHLRGLLVKGLKDTGCVFLSPLDNERGSGIVTFKPPKEASEELHEKLTKNNIIISYREGWLRVSPHFYNTEEEIKKLLENV